ncbi:hypothetical protein HGRIS_003244 [Hohenbuehelia grisea]|uniref:Uncharacterized protein n=1 Tax=Hohenbuehelia grisea TaxID=104357 RepID=A0ABR3JP93_9AGAR
MICESILSLLQQATASFPMQMIPASRPARGSFAFASISSLGPRRHHHVFSQAHLPMKRKSGASSVNVFHSTSCSHRAPLYILYPMVAPDPLFGIYRDTQTASFDSRRSPLCTQRMISLCTTINI